MHTSKVIIMLRYRPSWCHKINKLWQDCSLNTHGPFPHSQKDKYCLILQLCGLGVYFPSLSTWPGGESLCQKCMICHKVIKLVVGEREWEGRGTICWGQGGHNPSCQSQLDCHTSAGVWFTDELAIHQAGPNGPQYIPESEREREKKRREGVRERVRGRESEREGERGRQRMKERERERENARERERDFWLFVFL